MSILPSLHRESLPRLSLPHSAPKKPDRVLLSWQKTYDTRNQMHQLLFLPDRPREEPPPFEYPSHHLYQESIAHLLAHAQTRIRHLTTLTRGPSHPNQKSVQIQTDAANPTPNKSARKARRQKKNQQDKSTTSEDDETANNDLDLDEISWETIDAKEYNLIQEQWWHDFCAENDELGDRKEIRHVDPCATPRKEDCWDSKRNRKLIVADVAKPIWLEGASWNQVKDSIGIPLCCSNTDKQGESANENAVGKIFSKSLPLGEDDSLLDKLENIAGRRGKWRIFRDNRTNTVHRELILDRIDDARVAPIKYTNQEDQEKQLINDLEVVKDGAPSSKRWDDWVKLVRTTAKRAQTEEPLPNPFQTKNSAVATTDALTILPNEREKEVQRERNLAQKLSQLRYEESIIEGAMFELMTRHARDETRSKFKQAGLVRGGVIGAEYFARVWNTVSTQ
ncbi:UNVERIFIED_CONTAM: hypothetical protein HDU68_002657 [Siphonaria sp. JEL0065]|nr:hypothetical protein HDU68_002657 [Siphonaria sp. JEL0065]